MSPLAQILEVIASAGALVTAALAAMHLLGV